MLSLNKIFKKIFFDNSCSICKKEVNREGYLCKKCLKKLKEEAYLKNIKNYFYLFFYDDKIREVISDFKLRNRKELGKDIAYIIKEPLFELLENEKIDIIIPVPINLKREKERGFNQVEYLLEVLNIKYKKIKRIKNTKHMYRIKNYDEREKNVSNVFESSLNLTNKTVLLVDDIVTSGATTKSIEKELVKNNKDIKVKIFTLAIARKFINYED